MNFKKEERALLYKYRMELSKLSDMSDIYLQFNTFMAKKDKWKGETQWKELEKPHLEKVLKKKIWWFGRNNEYTRTSKCKQFSKFEFFIPIQWRKKDKSHADDTLPYYYYGVHPIFGTLKCRLCHEVEDDRYEVRYIYRNISGLHIIGTNRVK